MLKMLLSSESMMNLHHTFLHSSQTHATLVPAAALALSVASFSESPPSGCAQYYSPPTKYREIKGWVFWCSWEHKENGICSLFIFFLNLGSEKPHKKQFKFLNPALYILPYFWTKLSAFKTKKKDRQTKTVCLFAFPTALSHPSAHLTIHFFIKVTAWLTWTRQCINSHYVNRSVISQTTCE